MRPRRSRLDSDLWPGLGAEEAFDLFSEFSECWLALNKLLLTQRKLPYPKSFQNRNCLLRGKSDGRKTERSLIEMLCFGIIFIERTFVGNQAFDVGCSE